MEKTYITPKGTIHYWIARTEESPITLVFLPGLTADHRLFAKQFAAFKGKYNLFTWDAPGHYNSRPFTLDFSLKDKAVWLHEILTGENLTELILIGQSMGAYVGQAFMQYFPNELKGFISIDSAPLKRSYMTAAEIWLLKNVTPVYRMYPWNALQRDGAKGCAESAYGRNLMKKMMSSYEKEEYCTLAGHGYGMLARAVEANLPYEIDCPALLLCGEKDQAGSTKRYNKAWNRKEEIPLRWIEGAGHNSNTDNPEQVNAIIEDFIRKVK